MTHNQRMLLACALSLSIIMLWQELVIKPSLDNINPISVDVPEQSTSIKTNEHISPELELLEHHVAVARDMKAGHRIQINTPTIRGSINLRGARIDDITLKHFHLEADNASPNVSLFSPQNTASFYFAEFGWVPNGSADELPNRHTVWHTNDKELSAEHPIILYWANSKGVKFLIHISIDKNYMLKIKQTVENHSQQPLNISGYAALNRNHSYAAENHMLIHEGAISVLGKTLQEVEFEELQDGKKNEFRQQTGWVGFSDKYWLAALIPDASQQISGKFIGYPDNHGKMLFQADMLHKTQLLQTGESVSNETMLFVGAKELDILENYQHQYNIPLFDRAVDFGMLYFITKPIFLLLHYFHGLLGNFGSAILLLTVLIKLLLFPLAYKGFNGMNRMKDMQPQIVKLRDKYADDTAGMQQALLELYRKEKINPLAGCLPIFLQMPVFFALYKVLYVTIEMRHAPFFGWITDLSAPDPTNIFTLFGVISWPHPEFLHIGILPIAMALTMYLQQRLNPEPADPTQAAVMRWLPAMFLFMFAAFPSGLVLYWAWSNVLSIMQQVFIKKIGSK